MTKTVHVSPAPIGFTYFHLTEYFGAILGP